MITPQERRTDRPVGWVITPQEQRTDRPVGGVITPTRRHTMRLIGWVLATNAIGMLLAVTLGGTARDAVHQLALFCGLG